MAVRKPSPAQQSRAGLLENVSRRVGGGFVQPGRATQSPPGDVVPTGWADLDYGLLSVGGFPRGIVAEVVGPESSGKSLIALQLVAQAQKLWPNKACGWADAEERLATTFGRNWMVKQGVSYDELLLIGTPEKDDSDPLSGYPIAERVLDSVNELSRSGECSVIVVDSLAGLVPIEVLKSQHPDARSRQASKPRLVGEREQISALAGVAGRSMKQLAASAATGNCLILFTNQVRSNIRIDDGKPKRVLDVVRRWDDDETSVGGRAFKYHAAMRLYLARVDDLHEDGVRTKPVVGVVVAGKLVKSTVSYPRTQTGVDTPDHLHIRFDGKPVSQTDSLVCAAVRLGVVEQRGAYYYWRAKRVQGRENFVQWLDDTSGGSNRAQLVEDVKREASGEMLKPEVEVVHEL